MYSSPAGRSSAIVGSAVERMEVSRVARKVVTHNAGKTAQNRHVFLLDAGGGCVCGGGDS